MNEQGMVNNNYTYRYRTMAINSSRRRKDRGVAMIEVALSIPILFLIFGAVLDVGRLINQHLKTTRACYEGVRFMSRNQGLAQGCFGTACTALGTNSIDSISTQFNATFARITNMLVAQGLSSENFQVTARVENIPANQSVTLPLRNGANGGINTGGTFNRITFVVTLNYRPLLPIFPTVSTTSRLSSSDLAPTV